MVERRGTYQPVVEKAPARAPESEVEKAPAPVAKPATCACGSQIFYRRGIVQRMQGSQDVKELDVSMFQSADPDSTQPLYPYQCVKCSTEYTHGAFCQLGEPHE